MVIDMRSRTRSAFPRPTRSRTDPVIVEPDWSTISCDDCVMDGSDACQDCVVTFLCRTGEAAPVASVVLEFDDRETDTLRLFQAAGLAPALRHVARPS